MRERERKRERERERKREREREGEREREREILRLFNDDIADIHDVADIHPKCICSCRSKLDMIKKNSQREVTETEMAPFELHTNNGRFFMKHTMLSEQNFLVKYKNNVTEQEKPHSDLPREEFTIHETITCAKTQNITQTIENDMSLPLSSIKAYDGKPVINFSMKINKEDF